ncbi:MAG TPA: SAM-dependent methyltransferase, partial [Sporichthyaceae bacterium]|nr:SAM-dependent methyltransferase [Sporichthyaceae bacterium]
MSVTDDRMRGVEVEVDPLLWPDVAALPPGGLRARVARELFTRQVARLPLRVLLEDGRNIGGGG